LRCRFPTSPAAKEGRPISPMRRLKKISRPAKIIILVQESYFSQLIEKCMKMQCVRLLQPAQNRPKPGPKIDPMRLQDDLLFCSLVNIVFDYVSFGVVLNSIWAVLKSIWAPLGPPKCPRSGTLVVLNIDQQIDSNSDRAKGRSSKVAPRAPIR